MIDDERFGEIRQVELKPGGKAIQVTQENVILYTYLMADYKLNREIYQHSKAFINAFRSILNLGSNDSLSVLGLQLFSPSELQTLISGNGDDFGKFSFILLLFFSCSPLIHFLNQSK